MGAEEELPKERGGACPSKGYRTGLKGGLGAVGEGDGDILQQ